MFYLSLLSGAAFVATGAVLAAQARILDAGNPIPRTALGLLAAFSVLRGASYWSEMVGLAGGEVHAASAAFAALHVALLVASFALLFGFSLAAVPHGRRSPLVSALPIAAFAFAARASSELSRSARICNHSKLAAPPPVV